MNYIYETPWWLPAGVAMLGLILFVTGNNRLEKKLKWAGMALMGLAVALATLSFFLDSDREKVIKRTRGLVESVNARDWNRMGIYLHPNATVMVWTGRDSVVAAAKSAAESSDLRDVRTTSVDATIADEDTIRATLRVTATVKDGTTFTDWTLEWEKTDHGWVARNITLQGAPGLNGAMLEDIIRSRVR